MNMRDLIPWRRNGNTAPVANYRDSEANPFLTLHREMNRLFDDAFRSFDLPLASSGSLSGWMSNWPSVEISEDDAEIVVTAEIPGLSEEDIELVLEDGVLTLRGEKHAQNEDKGRHFSERFYGRFERRIPLGVEIEEDQVRAQFDRGELTVHLPKSAQARSRSKRIAINGNRKH